MGTHAALHVFKLSLEEFLIVSDEQDKASSSSSFLPPSQKQLLRSAHDAIDQLLKDIDKSDDLKLQLEMGPWGEKEKALLLDGIRDSLLTLEDNFDQHLRSTFTQLDETEIHSFIQLLAHTKKEHDKIWMEQVSLKLNENDDDWLTEDDNNSQENDVDDNNEEEEEEEVQVEKEIVEYEEDVLQSTSDYGMVGLLDEFIQLRRLLLLPRGGLHLLNVAGMAGIGKTAMAYQLYNDPLISKHFQRRAFVSVGRSPRIRQVVIDTLSQIQDRLEIVNMQRTSLNVLLKHMAKCLASKRCLIVFDDVWKEGALDLRYPDTWQESRILVTTRKVIQADELKDYNHHFGQREMRLLNEDESWCLFCEKVFGKDSSCPYKLVKLGKKIVENCEGLPIAIIAIADILAQGEMSVDYWKKVSEDPNPLSIGTTHQHSSLNTLLSSYEGLAQSVKAHFLYMGIFPKRQEIPISKLTRLWEAERLVKPQFHHLHSNPTLVRKQVGEILTTLSSQSVIFVTFPTLERGFKTCRLHSVFWHLCVSQARKEYVFHVVNKFSEDSFHEDLHGHRRICVHNNTLFGIKDANNLLLSMSSARSLLCTGPYHPYPVPMEFKMRLLRVLDVVTIRFYKFPFEVIQLVLLRYLAFTYHGLLHPSISQLCNLEYLIVEHHMRIISLEDPLYLPVEIWNMKKLSHLQVRGALLPSPPNGAVLPNLVSISKINARCLTTAVFDSIPSLLKLSIEINLSENDPFCFSDHLSGLDRLLSLKCVILNPKPRSQTSDPPVPSKIFPSKLSKLTLSGFGYPWEYIGELGEFKHLEVLKLRNYAFQGSEWGWELGAFQSLKVLHLEDLDLVHLRVSKLAISTLKKLKIRHCYRLREIPSKDIEWSSLELIEVVEVQPSVVASAQNIVQQQKNNGRELQLNISCSY